MHHAQKRLAYEFFQVNVLEKPHTRTYTALNEIRRLINFSLQNKQK